MAEADFNLLTALDMLLTTRSVAGAARRLGLSASAMSRTLSRLRTVTGDPLLVRAGREMVLTPMQKRSANVPGKQYLPRESFAAGHHRTLPAGTGAYIHPAGQ